MINPNVTPYIYNTNVKDTGKVRKKYKFLLAILLLLVVVEIGWWLSLTETPCIHRVNVDRKVQKSCKNVTIIETCLSSLFFTIYLIFNSDMLN